VRRRLLPGPASAVSGCNFEADRAYLASDPQSNNLRPTRNLLAGSTILSYIYD